MGNVESRDVNLVHYDETLRMSECFVQSGKNDPRILMASNSEGPHRHPLGDEFGVWWCQLHYSTELSCPQEICRHVQLYVSDRCDISGTSKEMGLQCWAVRAILKH